MVLELHGKIESDEKIYNVLKAFGELKLIDTVTIKKTSYNDFTDETYYYNEYIYKYEYKPLTGMEQLANDFVDTMYNYDIFN